MADSAKNLEFRATVAFLLNGVPHHVVGAWCHNKTTAKRDVAQRALGLFVDRWGELGDTDQSFISNVCDEEDNGRVDEYFDQHVSTLASYCQTMPQCDGAPPTWKVQKDGNYYQAVAELNLLGTPHMFSGAWCDTEAAAYDTFRNIARRILWYLRCPGYEEAFELDFGSLAAKVHEIPSPPANWVGDLAGDKSHRLAKEKTVLMRLQNRLQRLYGKQLRPGERVWEWSYETYQYDDHWCKASVHIPIVNKRFVGEWAYGQRDAQISACPQVEAFLSNYYGNSATMGMLAKSVY